MCSIRSPYLKNVGYPVLNLNLIPYFTTSATFDFFKFEGKCVEENFNLGLICVSYVQNLTEKNLSSLDVKSKKKKNKTTRVGSTFQLDPKITCKTFFFSNFIGVTYAPPHHPPSPENRQFWSVNLKQMPSITIFEKRFLYLICDNVLRTVHVFYPSWFGFLNKGVV